MGSNGNQVPMGESFQHPVPPAPVKEKARIEASTGYGALDETPEVRTNKLSRISSVHHRKTQSVRIASAITSALRQWWVKVVLKKYTQINSTCACDVEHVITSSAKLNEG